MSNELTEAQKKAVNSVNNVLVSAGAGSGKTRVLTERVIKNIIDKDNPVRLDNFLILTFTNAAAKEMKVRIKEALNKAGLFDLIYEVDSAHIETFDAYALYVVKKYGYVLGLPSKINNVPQDVIDVETRKLLDGELQILYDSNDETLKEFIKNYCFKSTKILESMILEMVKNLLELDFNERHKYVESYSNNFINSAVFDSHKDLVFKHLRKYIDLISNLIDDFENENMKAEHVSAYQEVICAKTFDELIPLLKPLESVKFSNANKKYPGEKENKEEINKLRKALCKYSNFKDLYYQGEDFENTKKFIPFLLNIALKIADELCDFEFSRGFFTFGEIAKLAFKILNEHQDICDEIRNKTKLIFIDEFQDTSNLQTEFIKKISNDNVFCVGDIKQSIYLFRGAVPKNFSDLYESYKKSDGENGKNHVIELNDNFRSRPEIVNGTNAIFNKIMKQNFGGADYSVGHNLNAMNPVFYNEGKIDGEHGVVKIINALKTDDIDYVISDIRKRIASKQMIFDGKKKREVSYKDFAILSTKGTSFIDYENRFREENIPAKVIYDEQLLSDDVVTVILNCFKFISLVNKAQLSVIEKTNLKHYFCSIARSFLCEYNDDLLYHLLETENDKNNEKYRSDPLFIKLKDFAYKHKVSILSVIYNDLIDEFDFVKQISRIFDPISKLQKLEIFADRVKIMDELNYDCDDFVIYLESINENGIKMENRHETEALDAVTITTIHKSKGLQYQIVYLIQLSSGNGGNNVSYGNNNIGYYLPSFAKNDAKPFQDCVMEEIDGTKFIEEKMRLLYVGITRAIDTCILVMPLTSKTLTDPEKGTSLSDFINCAENKGVKIPISSYCDLDEVVVDKSPNKVNAKSGIVYKNVAFDMSKNIVKTNASKDLKEGTDLNKLNYGTHMHLLMELVDFETKDTSFIKDCFERKKIDSVLNMDIFKDIKNDQVYKEYQFVDLNTKKNGVIDLLLIYKDHAIVVDYKLKNIDDKEYDKQLEVYKDFVESYFKLPTKCILLSLLKEDTREVL